MKLSCHRASNYYRKYTKKLTKMSLYSSVKLHMNFQSTGPNYLNRIRILCDVPEHIAHAAHNEQSQNQLSGTICKHTSKACQIRQAVREQCRHENKTRAHRQLLRYLLCKSYCCKPVFFFFKSKHSVAVESCTKTMCGLLHTWKKKIYSVCLPFSTMHTSV